MNIRLFKVAKEGLPLIFLIGMVGWIIALLGFFKLSFLIFILTLFTLSFFRDPERILFREENAVVSPADGEIIEISDKIEKDYLNRSSKKVSIFLSIFDCHINRFPVAGRVLGTKYYPGNFTMAFKKNSSDVNEKLLTYIETKNGVKLVLVQIAGLVARRIVSYATLGTEFAQGERFGIIKFGSRVDLYLPIESRIEVELNQKVRAGETVLAWIDKQEEKN